MRHHRGIDPHQVGEHVSVAGWIRGKRPLPFCGKAEFEGIVLARISRSRVGGVVGGRTLGDQGKAVGVVVGVQQRAERVRAGGPARASAVDEDPVETAGTFRRVDWDLQSHAVLHGLIEIHQPQHGAVDGLARRKIAEMGREAGREIGSDGPAAKRLRLIAVDGHNRPAVG